MMRHSTLRAAALALLLAGCVNAGEDLVFPVFVEGGISVGLYVDRDGTNTLTGLDTTFAGARVALLAANGVDTIRTGVSNANGVVVFGPIPVGSYRIKVDRSSVGDTLPVVVGDTGTIRILARTDSSGASRVVRLGYQEVSVAEARAMAPGRRVLMRGIVLSPLQFFRDSSMYLRDGTGNLRITRTRHRPGRNGNNLGDSVTVLGTTGSLSGSPVLLNGIVSTLGSGLPLVAEVITVADAKTARNGALDAALVQVVGAKLSDTASVVPDFLVRFLNPADSSVRATALFDSLLLAPPAIFVNGRTITVRGVMMPRGDGTWVIRVRTGLDLTLTN